MHNKRLIYLLLLLDHPTRLYNNKALQRHADDKQSPTTGKMSGSSVSDKFANSINVLEAETISEGGLTLKGDESDIYDEPDVDYANLKKTKSTFKKAFFTLVEELNSFSEKASSREEIENKTAQINKLIKLARKEHGLSLKYEKEANGRYTPFCQEGKARLSDDAEKARKNIRQNISTVIDKDLKGSFPELSRYLKKCITFKQSYAMYSPELHETEKNVRFHIEW